MSSTKQRRRRQKATNFLDSQEIQNVQINEQVQKHKLEGKTQNMFDAHLLQQNHFLKKQKDQIQMNSNVIGLEEDEPQKKQVQQTIQQTVQQSNNKKKVKRKRVKKQIFDSEEDQQQAQQQVNESNHQKKHSQMKRKEEKEDINVISQQSQEEKQKDDEEFNEILQKKSESQQVVIHLHTQIGKLPKQQRKQFYYQPLKKGEVAFCYFKRYTSGLSDYFQITGQDHRPLLFCQNQRGCIGCNYYISMTKQMDKSKPAYLGKLRGNASGSTYILYDCGTQPNKSIDRSQWRVSMGCIQYETNFMGMKGPRKLKAVLPRANNLQDFDMFKLSEQQSLLNFKPPVVKQYRNKTPRWNDKLKSYALNFGGRVKQASIKNFILIDDSFAINDQDQAQNKIIFGKIDQSTFSLQFRHPLSLYQAFGIAMSEFDFKLNCQ